MLGQDAAADPIQAVGGDGVIFLPVFEDKPLSRKQLAAASREVLLAYYAPIYVQQRACPPAQRYPYPPEYDLLGQAHLCYDGAGKLKSYVSGPPRAYAMAEKLRINGREHGQLIYTVWYPAHPRMKTIDLEEADVDSCVVRVTLDDDHAPLFYETISACGCFHKVFIARWIEEAARQAYGPPEKGKKYSVERAVEHEINWEVAGLVDAPADQPRRPVLFLKAGDHKVIGLGSAARLRLPATAEAHPYVLVSYGELYAIAVDGTDEQAPFFDVPNGRKVHGAERRGEKLLFSFAGVDAAGQPRSNEKIKMHFDQTSWDDPSIYARYLRLPPGIL
jgi:hypothetical protein